MSNANNAAEFNLQQFAAVWDDAVCVGIKYAMALQSNGAVEIPQNPYRAEVEVVNV